MHVQPVCTARQLLMPPLPAGIGQADELEQAVLGAMNFAAQQQDFGNQRFVAHAIPSNLYMHTVSLNREEIVSANVAFEGRLCYSSEK